MGDSGHERTVGVEMNGHVWDGHRWVPKAPEARRQSTQGDWPPPSGTSSGPGPGWSPFAPSSGVGFANPYYAYGLTKRAADDIQFIARFAKVMIWIYIIGAIAAIVPLVVMIPMLLGALGSMARPR